MARLFTAVDPPDPIAREIAALRDESLDGRWTDPGQYHLTLRFIGEVDREHLPRIQRAVEPGPAAPFDLHPRGLGVFPSRRNPRVLWVDFENQPALFDLQSDLERRLVATGLEPEDRPFTPHLTIARVGDASAESVHRYLKAHESFETDPFTVGEIHLYESELGPSGPEHRRLASYALE